MQQNIAFSEKALELQAIARKIADEVVRPGAAHADKHSEYNMKAARAVADAGLFQAWIPEAYGGLDAGVLALALVAEELAKADSGFGVAYAVNALGSFPILPGGTEEQKQKWMPKIAAGETFVAFCSPKFAPAPTRAVSRCARCAMGTTTSSTARRSGRPTAASRTSIRSSP